KECEIDFLRSRQISLIDPAHGIHLHDQIYSLQRRAGSAKFARNIDKIHPTVNKTIASGGRKPFCHGCMFSLCKNADA
ncbi:MAG TPA: hypothetical protein PK953_11920, partial [Smithellaceae bacterium]|nr:hypothetical protein [Smithellaceae bacterium]HPV73212.1 hypothetical protein [Smithellaceae bacterium]HQC11610.1 hypothetical protein [Smithellaceae bacterium]